LASFRFAIGCTVKKSMGSYAIVVPCYNEADRLDGNAFLTYLAGHRDASVVFVNDGSVDGTLALLQRLQRESPEQIEVVDKKQNGGKAEAVRDGMLYALGQGRAEYVGFWDADLATPLAAIQDLMEVFHQHPEIEVVFGSRVKLLGRKIERRSIRHYLGRVFATCASLVLNLPVYDTQCGAKFFRVTPTLPHVLQEPFYSRWIFDVEMIARFLQAYGAEGKDARGLFYEFPLNYWKDVAGSKVRPSDFLKAGRELMVIRNKYLTGKTRGSLLQPVQTGGGGCAGGRAG
jgi:dolichyl-phosphate beta-glucosyltransferase